jgi:hypothetical protein
MRSLCHVTGAPVCNADHAQRRSSTIARDVFAGLRICALPAPLRRSYPLPLPSRYAPEPVPTRGARRGAEGAPARARGLTSHPIPSQHSVKLTPVKLTNSAVDDSQLDNTKRQVDTVNLTLLPRSELD